MRFKSIPHEIEAFQFTKGKISPPHWFVEEYERGNIQITMNAKHDYVAIYTADGEHKAFLGDWICRNEAGTIFPMRHCEMQNGFKPV